MAEIISLASERLRRMAHAGVVSGFTHMAQGDHMVVIAGGVLNESYIVSPAVLLQSDLPDKKLKVGLGVTFRLAAGFVDIEVMGAAQPLWRLRRLAGIWVRP